MLSAAPTVLSSWVRVLVQAAQARGIELRQLCERVPIEAALLRDGNARMPAPDVARLWHAAVELSGDPAFGLRVPRYARPTTCHGLGYAVLASATLREGLGRFVRYAHVITDSVLFELAHEGDDVVLRLRPCLMRGRGGEAFRDSLMSMVVRVMRTLGDGQAQLRKVTLDRASGFDRAPYHGFFSTVVERGPDDALYFATEPMEQPLPTSNPQLARHNDDAVHTYLAHLGSGSIVDRTRAVIAAQSRLCAPPDEIARRLGMSLRSLQRGLSSHGTSYEELLLAWRRELACAHLREARYSVAEIAFLLGYDSTSAFARAFRRWTGQAPTEYRAPA